MKKFILFLFLVAFLTSCGTHKSALNQTWLPNKHKPQNLSKPPKPKKRN